MMCPAGDVAKLVDAPDLGSGVAIRESSSLSIPTIYMILYANTWQYMNRKGLDYNGLSLFLCLSMTHHANIQQQIMSTQMSTQC